GIGDDCAVLALDNNNYQLFTTDTLVDGTHFHTIWQTAYQVGCKLVEVNVSDILAMGGYPTSAVIALTIPEHTDVKWVQELYKGISAASSRHNMFVTGGDTTRGPNIVLTLALLGNVPHNRLKLRSTAIPEDIICVTGTLGKSAAGLAAFQNNITGNKDGYLSPKARTVEESSLISKFASAMIDISDGLASEITHICTSSNTGSFIEAKNIPISEDVKAIADKIRTDPLEWALYGGEDYELLFTIPAEYIASLKKEFSDFTQIGKILSSEKDICLIEKGKITTVKPGFDHFKQ
ncbi:MAG: thiamine-phosphate kinase, partial [Candidatus Theseobacter exili]|nr:thiamine-phosphate kinase [Candidatus Theseobacter exili]